MTTVRVEVTAKDIGLGKRGAASQCPIALAVRRATSFDWAVVYHDRIILGLTRRKIVPTPPEAVEFACRFDTGDPVVPFAFDLDVPA